MTPGRHPPDRALSVARRVARDGGGHANRGSHARGDAGPEPDLDLLAVGKEPNLPRLELRDGLLASGSVQPLAAHRESSELPEMVCGAVLGWREVVVPHDPKGLAAFLVR